MSARWDQYFLDMALRSAAMSKDPSTKVGAVIVNKHRGIVSTGFNGFPMGVEDSVERYANRELKLQIVVHAEMNAILMAARMGHSTNGCTMYIAATDGTSEVWGGPPCVRCTVECMQAGIVEYVSRPKKLAPSRWQASIEQAHGLIHEAGLKYREVAIPPPRFREANLAPYVSGAGAELARLSGEVFKESLRLVDPEDKKPK